MMPDLTCLRKLSLSALISLVVLAGCGDTVEKQMAKQVEKSPNSIMGKTTQDIGEFDPNAKQEVSDSKVRIDTNDITAPVTAPLQAYGPMVEQISKTHVAHALSLFNATEGRYPESYDEFMEKIIKANNIRLPVLPFKHTYSYDVANHELVVIKPPAAEAAAEGAAAPGTP
jgi:hypothetical protein